MLCVAARISLIFGHRIGRTRWITNDNLPGPAPELPSLMTLLHDAGFATHCVGKTHFRSRHYGFHRIESSEEVIDSVADDDCEQCLRKNGDRVRHQNGLRDPLFYQPQTSGIPAEHHKTTWVTNRSVDSLKIHVRYIIVESRFSLCPHGRLHTRRLPHVSHLIQCMILPKWECPNIPNDPYPFSRDLPGGIAAVSMAHTWIRNA